MSSLLKRFYIWSCVLTISMLFINFTIKKKMFQLPVVSHSCFTLTRNASRFNEIVKNEGVSGTNRAVICKHFVAQNAEVGRTGNQMFQIAAVFGIAFEYNFIPLVSSSTQLARYFDLPNMHRMKLVNSRMCKQFDTAVYGQCLNSSESSHRQNVTLHGYFQSWKYFKKAEGVIRSIFTIRSSYLKPAELYLRGNSKEGLKNICIHVRRGDMDSYVKRSEGIVVVDVDFIYRAIRFWENKYERTKFFVLSDSMEWCRKYIKHEHVTFSHFQEPGYDLALMTLCDHVVVTSGTFGWWGAWLSNRTAVYFKGFPRPGSRASLRYKHEDYYPPHWIGLM